MTPKGVQNGFENHSKRSCHFCVSRKKWREFCLCKEDLSEWFDLDVESPYMLLVADINSNKKIERIDEQIENLNTSGLLFVLSNPSVETDVKIFCSELLIKQGRISFDFLSEAYLLPRYKNAELENALNLYKTLSPAKARPLLYQSIIIEKNEEVKFQKIVALLKMSIIDNLFTQISSLVYKFVELQNLTKSKEQILLISKMFQVQNEFEKADYCRDKIKELKRKLIEV